MNKFYYPAVLLFVLLFAASANGAPMAYSVNSDSNNESFEDNLYLIDLETGAEARRGPLFTGIEKRGDTEGLAFAPDDSLWGDGTLWGIDDQSLTLFPINTASGTIKYLDEISLSGIPTGGGNDFGMTFSCDNTLYITSVATRTLYSVDSKGISKFIGSPGALDVNISAIAAIGNPTRLYGLGNGQLENGDPDSPNLYSIDTVTGTASLIGALGSKVFTYNQGGLAFDSSGDLWAITDRRTLKGESTDQTSQVFRIDISNGTASLIKNTGEVGFESLAIAPPADCGSVGGGGFGSDDGVASIPTLSLGGRLLAILVLLLTGFGILRKGIT